MSNPAPRDGSAGTDHVIGTRDRCRRARGDRSPRTATAGRAPGPDVADAARAADSPRVLARWAEAYPHPSLRPQHSSLRPMHSSHRPCIPPIGPCTPTFGREFLPSAVCSSPHRPYIPPSAVHYTRRPCITPLGRALHPSAVHSSGPCVPADFDPVPSRRARCALFTFRRVHHEGIRAVPAQLHRIRRSAALAHVSACDVMRGPRVRE